MAEARSREGPHDQFADRHEPLLEPWTGPFEAPPFDRFEPRHFRPTFDAALKQVRAEIDSVAADWLGSTRGRVGYAWDRLLIYGTGGVAYGGGQLASGRFRRR